jgi:hypothetical protein
MEIGQTNWLGNHSLNDGKTTQIGSALRLAGF